MDYSLTSILDCADSNQNKCSCSFVDDPSEVCSKQTAEAYHEPGSSCGPSKCSSLQLEILDIRAQLENLQATIDDMVKSHGQCYESLAQDFYTISWDYESTSNTIVNKQTKNSDLRNALRCKEGIKLQTVRDIEQLECDIAQATECNKMLENKIHKEQVTVNSLEQQLLCLENLITRRKVQTDGLRCEAAAEENALCCKKAKLQELHDRNAERCRVAKGLTAERWEREAAMATLKEDTGPLALTAAARAVDVARMALADTCDAAAEWESRRARADDDGEQAGADGDAQWCNAQAALRDLTEERDRLADRLTVTAARLTAANDDRQLLAASVKANADRMACLRAETERSKQRAHHKRSVRATQQANVEAENKSIENRRAADRLLLAAVDSEVEALKLASARHEEAIERARQELQKHCSTMDRRR